jgi:hypothetical protein
MHGSVRKVLAVVAAGVLAAVQLGAPAEAASDPGIVFTNPVAADGITAWPGDPDKIPEHAASSRLGVPCWQTSQELKDQYIYLNIDAARIPAGATDAVLTVNYFDTPGQQLTAQYDSVSAAFTPLPWFSFPGTGAWASTQFRMSNINFQNRANGADIRLMANAPGGVINSVCVPDALPAGDRAGGGDRVRRDRRLPRPSPDSARGRVRRPRLLRRRESRRPHRRATPSR